MVRVELEELLQDVEGFAENIRYFLCEGWKIDGIYHDNNSVYVNFTKGDKIEHVSFSAWED